MTFELTNEQRRHFGLDPVEPLWERVTLSGDRFRPGSVLYFDGDTIRRRVISTEEIYQEDRYEERTEGRSILLPKTARGKPQKLTSAVLEGRTPLGIYLHATRKGRIKIASYATQTTFYSTDWEETETPAPVPDLFRDFIAASPPDHLREIEEFRVAKKRHVQFRSGDYFRFKLDRARFGFGRVLLDIHKIRTAGLLPKDHGLCMPMTRPVLVQPFGVAMESRSADVGELARGPKLPSGLMMDNHLFYGEYEIIGHQDLAEEEFEFPISHGRSIELGKETVFLQWGLIHRELPRSSFDKHLVETNPFVAEDDPSRKSHNPYGFYAIGLAPTYGAADISTAAKNRGVFDFEARRSYWNHFDLRNPRNAAARREILEAFGLDPEAGYLENCRRTGTLRTTDLLQRLG